MENQHSPRLHSTGPRTAAGKHKSSQNSRTHAILSKILAFSSPEDQAEFDELFADVYQTVNPMSKMAGVEVNHLVHLYWQRRRIEQMRERLLEALEAGDEQKTLEDFLAKTDVLRISLPGACRSTGTSKNKNNFLWHCDNLVLRIGNDQQEHGEIASQKQPYEVVRDGAAEHYGIEMHLSSKLKLLDRYHTTLSREIDRVLNRLRTIRELEKKRA